MNERDCKNDLGRIQGYMAEPQHVQFLPGFTYALHLDDNVKARAWRPEDEQVIRMGIPCGEYAVKTDAAV